MAIIKKARLAVISTAKRFTHKRPAFIPYTPLDFSEIQKQAQYLADHIEAHFEDIAHVLLEYESYEVVVDEISRTLDLLRNLQENEEFFTLRIGAVAAFLPRNQPLYALACFVIVPSFMASEVHFRIPHAMRHFFPKLLALLNVYGQFPNILVSHNHRIEFLQERTAMRVSPETKESVPVTEAVIFTGTPAHAEQLRMVFDPRTLFITNGSGHNPVIVSKDADIDKAVEAALSLQLYNQGQDCAAPDAVLVHHEIFSLFLRKLRDKLRSVGVGDYRDRACRVGPISEPKDLARIEEFLIEHRSWLDSTTPGIIRASDATLEPTIISKPLKEGGNFTEMFAPIIFLQEYDHDKDLALYFENPHYAQNAMYITVYGTSSYVNGVVGKQFNGKVLHDAHSILHDTHLHAYGMERGTQPYGGNGYGASNVSINGNIICKPTLPQRDIYEWVAKPILNEASLEAFQIQHETFTETVQKDVAKLLKLKSRETETEHRNYGEGKVYVDVKNLKEDGNRYVSVSFDDMYQLLAAPNAERISQLEPFDVELIRSVRKTLQEETPVLDEFNALLYALPKEGKGSEELNRSRQLRFFKNLYQLLLGKDAGPRLAQFLLEADREHVCKLLDV